METEYLSGVKQLFEFYKVLGDRTIEQVPADKLNWIYNEESNSIAIIVQHLSGNMISRWTDFLTSDGEKPWRDRDAEFEEGGLSGEQVLQKWNAGWECLWNSFHALRSDDLHKTIYIRNMGHTALDAINRQLSHIAYHIGQMVFLGKMICGKEWKSLSIPKGNSTAFNEDKFSRPKHMEHFTSDLLRNDEADKSKPL